MDVVFVTHNELGLACLEELTNQGATIQSLYTRPVESNLSDQTDFETFANEYDIPLHRIDSINDDEIKTQIQSKEPEFLFVIGWSQLVEDEVLQIPSEAALGMHPAPLPRGRGRAPIAWSLIKGLNETALSFFHLEEEADAGPLVGQYPIEIELRDDASTLYAKIVHAGRELIRRYYPGIASGKVPKSPQDEAKATWWPKRTPSHGLIDWNQPPMEIYNWIRGQTHPYPGAFSYLDGDKVTIWRANPPTGKFAFVQPGEIAYKDGMALGVGAWEGIIEITNVQVDGGESISAGQLLTECNVDLGDKFIAARDFIGEHK